MTKSAIRLNKFYIHFILFFVGFKPMLVDGLQNIHNFLIQYINFIPNSLLQTWRTSNRGFIVACNVEI